MPDRVTYRNVLEILANSDIRIMYRDMIVEQICKLVTENLDKKNEIYFLTSCLITQLRNEGYSDEYIFLHNNAFFTKLNKINDAAQINDYFKSYTKEDKEFEIIFKDTEQISRLEGLRSIRVKDDIPYDGDKEAVRKFIKSKESHQKFLSIGIFAKDMYSARYKALELINHNVELLSLFYHKNSMPINTTCVAFDLSDKSYTVIKDSTPAIFKCKSMSIKRAVSQQQKFYKSIECDTDAANRLTKALKLHKAALSTNIVENQFINLFTALEVLIPKDINTNNDRISQIFDTLIPYLSIEYNRKLLDSAYADLQKWDKQEIEKLLEEVSEGDSKSEKLLSLIVLKKYDSELKESLPLDRLYRKLTSNKAFLLRFRLARLHQQFKSYESILDNLSKHENRLRWHIDRIYRTRNSIVHAGISPKCLPTLVENLHSYLDILISQLLIDVTDNGISELGHSYTICSLKYNEYKEYLKNEINVAKKNKTDLTQSEDELIKAVLKH
jgi:hypothetical protein